MATPTRTSTTAPRTIQKDLELLKAPAVENYKSYQTYLKDFQAFQRFRQNLMADLSLANRPASPPKLTKVLAHPGDKYRVLLPDGHKTLPEIAQNNLRFGDIKRLIPEAVNFIPVPTENQERARKGRSKAKRAARKLKKAQQLKKELLTRVQVATLQEKLKKKDTSFWTLNHSRNKQDISRVTEAAKASVSRTVGKQPTTHAPTGEILSTGPGPSYSATEPRTPVDRRGLPISPLRSEINDDAWRALLEQQGEPARAKRREILKKAAEREARLASRPS